MDCNDFGQNSCDKNQYLKQIPNCNVTAYTCRACPEPYTLSEGGRVFLFRCYKKEAKKPCDIANGTGTQTYPIQYYIGDYVGNPTTCTVSRCNSGYYKNGNSCEICPKGHYCSNNIKTECPSGRYQPSTGQSSCLTCPPSHPNSNSGSTSINNCYKTGAQRPCTISNGTGVQTCNQYKNGTYSSNCTTCTASSCNPGYYKNGNSCQACPPSHPNSNSGSTSINNCYKTVSNVSCNVSNGKGTKTCQQYHNSSNNINCSDCKLKSCNSRYYQNGNSCITCPAGSYCPKGSSNPLPCILGGTSASGSSSITDCFKTNAAFNNSKGTGIYSGQCQYKE